MDNVAGTIFRPTTTAGVTVRLAELATDPLVALIVAVPVALARTEPAGLTLATADADELHVTDCVRFCTVPSEKLPVAVSGSDSPTGKDDGFGLTAIPSNAAGPTVTDVLPVTPS
jgi:hypothetical protein